MKRECLSRQIADVKKRASPEKDRTGRLAVIDFVQSAARHGMDRLLERSRSGR